MSNPKYDSSDFLVPAKDNAGRSQQVKLQINRDDVYTLDAIVASGVFPYRSRSDMHRHAISLLIAHLSTLVDVTSLVVPYRLRMEPSSQSSRAGYFQWLFEILKEKVDHHLAMGREESARRLLEEARTGLNKEPRDFWKDMFLRLINRRWGVFLSGPLARPRKTA